MSRTYEIEFKDGSPTLSEGVHHHLREKGFDDIQIKLALDTISRELVKKAIQFQGNLDKSGVRYVLPSY